MWIHVPILCGKKIWLWNVKMWNVVTGDGIQILQLSLALCKCAHVRASVICGIRLSDSWTRTISHNLCMPTLRHGLFFFPEYLKQNRIIKGYGGETAYVDRARERGRETWRSPEEKVTVVISNSAQTLPAFKFKFPPFSHMLHRHKMLLCKNIQQKSAVRQRRYLCIYSHVYMCVCETERACTSLASGEIAAILSTILIAWPRQFNQRR